MPFLNKVVLVAGADSNLGEAIALNFAKKSARLYLIGQDLKYLKKTAEYCEKVSKTKMFTAQIQDNNDIQTTVVNILKEFGKIDVVINCVQRYKTSSILDQNLMQNFDEIMESNVKSVLTLTHFVVKALAKSKGVIINVVSGVAKEDIPNMLDNVAAALLQHLTKHLALELAAKGVRVNAITSCGTLDDTRTALGVKGDYSQTPLKRAVKSEDVAELVTFLANDSSKSVTGGSYNIDSGALLLR